MSIDLGFDLVQNIADDIAGHNGKFAGDAHKQQPQQQPPFILKEIFIE